MTRTGRKKSAKTKMSMSSGTVERKLERRQHTKRAPWPVPGNDKKRFNQNNKRKGKEAPGNTTLLDPRVKKRSSTRTKAIQIGNDGDQSDNKERERKQGNTLGKRPATTICGQRHAWTYLPSRTNRLMEKRESPRGMAAQGKLQHLQFKT